MASEGKMASQGSELKMKNKSEQKMRKNKLMEEVLSILKEPKAPVPLFGEDVLKALDQLVAANDQLQLVVGKDQLQLVAEEDQVVGEMDQLVVEKNQLKADLQKLKDEFEEEKKELTTTISMVMDAANQEFMINEELRKEIRRLGGDRR